VKLVPISIREAKRYVAHHHRHLRAPQGALFAIGAEKDGQLVGVAIVGRPTGRGLQDGYTCEITRVATDGTRNTCSFLYSRSQRALTALGYDPAKTKTYTREDESGTSLRAAGFVQEALLPARSYAKSNVKRRRFDKSTPVPRIRWGWGKPDRIEG
jgi:hypothetical protein